MKHTIRRTLLLPFAMAAVATVGVTQHTSAYQHDRLSGPPDTSVAYWDTITTQSFAASGWTAPEGFTLFGYVSIAMYDSVMAIEGGYERFAVDAEAPDGASPQAAVAGAAHAVLVHFLPAQVGMLNAALATALSQVPDGPAEADGVAAGAAVAAEFLGQRTGDGFRAPGSYTAPNPPIPGAWIPTGATPIAPSLGDMRPFSLDSADRIRPKGPPALDSKAWAKDYNEVRDIGSSTSDTRTQDETTAARFWAEAPVQQARGSFRRFVTDHQLDVVDAARFMAMVSVTQADAMIACFDAKYHYAFWRPLTAVRAGATDGNDATVGDPAWTPLLASTPNHPEYPSAHSCVTPSSAQVLVRFLDTQHIDFVVPSLTGLGDRRFATAHDLATEVANARIWGGIHFRSAVEDGRQLGKRVANHVLAHHFHPTVD